MTIVGSRIIFPYELIEYHSGAVRLNECQKHNGYFANHATVDQSWHGSSITDNLTAIAFRVRQHDRNDNENMDETALPSFAPLSFG